MFARGVETRGLENGWWSWNRHFDDSVSVGRCHNEGAHPAVLDLPTSGEFFLSVRFRGEKSYSSNQRLTGMSLAHGLHRG
jgi:hypothetical protein